MFSYLPSSLMIANAKVLFLPGDVAQLVELVSNMKPWVQSPAPYKPGVVAHGYNFCTWRLEDRKFKSILGYTASYWPI